MNLDLQLITFTGRRGDRDEREERGSQDWVGRWLLKYLQTLVHFALLLQVDEIDHEV